MKQISFLRINKITPDKIDFQITKYYNLRLSMKLEREEGETQGLDFTFFPDTDENSQINGVSPDELVEILKSQPDMSARIFYELWRNGESGRIHQAMSLLGGEEAAPMLWGFYNDAVESSSLMCYRYSVPLETAEKFIKDVMGVLILAANGKPFEAELDGELMASRQRIINSIMNPVKQNVQTFRARLN
jgi:hypothetical protein